MAKANDFFRGFYSNLSDTEYEKLMADSIQKAAEKQARKEASKFQCRIPDWTGQGGMVEFWINEDNTFECEDSRINDSMIREGLLSLARW
jgi:hypothetical protein